MLDSLNTSRTRIKLPMTFFQGPGAARKRNGEAQA